MPACPCPIAACCSPATDLTLSGPSLQYNADADVMLMAAGDLLPDLYCPGQLRTNRDLAALRQLDGCRRCCSTPVDRNAAR